jgi:hypothetical protein
MQASSDTTGPFVDHLFIDHGDVTCSSGSATRSLAASGFLISVHTYCELEIDSMQSGRSPDLSHRLCVAAVETVLATGSL